MSKDLKVYYKVKQGEMSEIFNTLGYFFEKNKQETLDLCVLTAWKALIKEYPQLEKVRQSKNLNE